jgi:hypothetical protein
MSKATPPEIQSPARRLSTESKVLDSKAAHASSRRLPRFSYRKVLIEKHRNIGFVNACANRESCVPGYPHKKRRLGWRTGVTIVETEKCHYWLPLGTLKTEYLVRSSSSSTTAPICLLARFQICKPEK